MKVPRSRPVALFLVAATWALIVPGSSVAAGVQGTYLYTLSNFTGSLRYDWVRVHVDQERNETYVLYQNLIRIFNPSGMEIFSFGDDLDLGQILDAVVDRNGDVLLLSYKDSRSLVTRCNFRGVPVGSMEIRNLPDGTVFAANRMIFRNGLFYFVSSNASSVIVTDSGGEFREHIDLLALLEEDERKKGEAELMGITVDREGNIFFTVPVLFRVFKLTPDRKLSSFGRSGSAPGRFGIVAGIVTDSRGNLLVTDKLRCVVMVFDKDFTFLSEFGYRGSKPENLVVPDDIAIDQRDRIYVSQGRRRGVSVFALTSD
jgi:hypothetical protein